MRHFIQAVFKARELAIKLDKQMKLSINMYIPSDQVLCNLSKKFEISQVNRDRALGKSIMKKPGTPITGKRPSKQTL